MVGQAQGQEFKCLVCEEKVESKAKTQRRICFSYPNVAFSVPNSQKSC